MMSSGMNLVTTVIGFGMSATFIVFVCARLICGRIRSRDSQAHAAALDSELRSDDESEDHTISILEPAVIATIPTTKYSKEVFKSSEDTQCTICLGEYQEREVLRVMPRCKHSFHLACIDMWLQKQSTCPICRLPLSDSSSEVKRTTSSFHILRPLASPPYRSDRSFHWRLTDNQHPRDDQSGRDMYESLSVTFETPGETPEARR